MKEVILISVRAGDGGAKAFGACCARWQSNGWPVDFLRRVAFPFDDERWLVEVKKAARAREIAGDWQVDKILQEYSEADVAEAPLFRFVHTGGQPMVATGRTHRLDLSHVTEYSSENACKRCGAGARQIAPLRFTAGALNKLTTGFATLSVAWCELVLISQTLRNEIKDSIGVKLPLRELEVSAPRGARLREKWWQLDADEVVAPEHLESRRLVEQRCALCDGVRVENPPEAGFVWGGYWLAEKSLGSSKAPPVVRMPYWEGDLDMAPGGGVRLAPYRSMLFRGDVARWLMTKGITKLFFTPIIWRTASVPSPRAIHCDERHIPRDDAPWKK